jgi:transglutaminase-like putative cysteine protease
MKAPAWLLLWLVTGVVARPIAAQEALARDPPEWGKIPREHLVMDHYAPDSGAAAVILADVGHLYFAENLDMVFERHTRVKILTEGGYEWGTVTIPYRAADRTQLVTNIQGRTYRPADGDRVQIDEMTRNSIFDENVDGEWKQIRFTLPALQPGAVIEYRYRVVSKDPVLVPDWAFQTGEPVLWSEFRADIPELFRYVSAYQGEIKPDVAEQEPYSRRMSWIVDLPRSAMYSYRNTGQASTDVHGVKSRWVMRNVPALRWEPYMTTPEDFRAKIRFELAEFGRTSTPTVQVTTPSGTVSVPGTVLPVKQVMTSWEQLAEELMDSRLFGKQIGDHRAVRDQARVIVEGITDPLRRTKAIYDYLRTTMVWTGQRGVLLDQDLDEALRARSGDSPEIALLLVSMLREAGLEAYPVIMSTRNHGQVLSVYPLLSQFNHVLAYVEVDSAGYLLDATDSKRPFPLLPSEALNGTGFLVRHPDPGWVTIAPVDDYWHRRTLDVALDASGTLTGTVRATEGGYSALESRGALEDAETPAAFVREALLDAASGALVDSCSVTDEADTLELAAAFSAPGYAQVAGDFIYLNPTALGRFGENPLRRPERAFPVDLIYPRRQHYNVLLRLPEGYAVQEVPRSVRIRLPGDSAIYQRLLDVQDGELRMEIQVVIRQTVFEPERYGDIRQFFERIVATEAEQVVLKRVTAPEP